VLCCAYYGAVIAYLLSRRLRQRERLSASVLSICSFDCLSVCLSPKCKKIRDFLKKLSNLELWCLLTTCRKLCNWAFQRTHYWIPKIQDGWDPPSWKSTWRHYFAEGGPIWIKCRRLVQNDMSTAVMWSKSKPDVEFQYWRTFALIQWHVTPEPHITLQGVRIPSAILKIVSRHILFIFCY